MAWIVLGVKSTDVVLLLGKGKVSSGKGKVLFILKNVWAAWYGQEAAAAQRPYTS
jgi:hypothetical protein